VAVLYSPIGSPDLYKPSNNYVPNQSVSLNGGAIENDQNISFESNNDNNELIIPDYSSDDGSHQLPSANYSYATSADANTSSGATSYSSSGSQLYQNMKNDYSGGMNAGGVGFASSEGSGASGAGSTVAMTGGGVTTLSALTMLSPSKANQYIADSGGQNPGGDPDAGTRIPIPDGWGFLLLLAASYGIIKKKFFTA